MDADKLDLLAALEARKFTFDDRTVWQRLRILLIDQIDEKPCFDSRRKTLAFQFRWDSQADSVVTLPLEALLRIPFKAMLECCPRRPGSSCLWFRVAFQNSNLVLSISDDSVGGSPDAAPLPATLRLDEWVSVYQLTPGQRCCHRCCCFWFYSSFLFGPMALALQPACDGFSRGACCVGNSLLEVRLIVTDPNVFLEFPKPTVRSEPR
eukprot:gnl/Spiro4/18457_TR9879_c0_g1_i1.p1 gnl/Spiro4/18457_TR9879_c0_g1~~gnl/Spiro4/18457_TR9879_c0_g1_i1.p1  ORF type:complete len:208 (-),score=11.84 gnl/Spiro4/18457_TR9879_c0_g1_i1:63-686(-)